MVIFFFECVLFVVGQFILMCYSVEFLLLSLFWLQRKWNIRAHWIVGRQKFSRLLLTLNGRAPITDQFFEVGNEFCSRAIKSNISIKQLNNSSLQALWLNSSVEISS